MDLAQLTSDLEELRARATSAAASAPDTAALDGIEVEVLGKKGELTAILRGIGVAAGRGPPEGRRGRQPGPHGGRGLAVRGPDAARRRGARRATRRRGDGRHHPRSPDPPRVAPPDRRDRPGDRRRLRAVRVRRLRGTRDRGRRHQLPDAQHPARSPGARPVGHAVPRCRGQAPAHAHEPGPDPRDAARATPDPRAAARPLLPVRGGGRQPRIGVLPGRGADDRRGHVDGAPQGPARPVRPRDVRRGPGHPLPAGLLPVHGAVGRVRHPVRRSATARSARRARGRAG